MIRLRSATRGAVTIIVAVAIVALAMAIAFAVDTGRVVAAAHEAQRAADTAALAGVQADPGDTTAATANVAALVADNSAGSTFTLAQAADSPSFYGPGATVPGFRTLAITENALRVVVETDVHHFFAPMVGLTQTRVTRSAIAARMTAAGADIVPMWISVNTPMTVGESTELHMSEIDIAPLPSGNFGWLTPDTGADDFYTLLGGYQVPPEIAEGNQAAIGDVEEGLTGQRVGLWARSLGTTHDGRLDRAAEPPYDTQTPDNYTWDNPRLMIVPLVEVIGGTGGNAEYTIVRFALFWLTDVNGGQKSITGILLDDDVPGLPGTSAGQNTGLWTAKLVG